MTNSSNDNQQNIEDDYVEDFLNTEMYSFDMVDGEKSVGEVYISIHRKKRDRGQQIYPASWFVDNSDQLKPILEIDGFGTIGNSGAGYGRAGLQRAYEMSLEKGCEGRMEVHATWGAGSFYEHCGFIGKEKGKPGIKCFEPTQENIEKLYKGGRRENLTFKLAEPMDLKDCILDELVETKADNKAPETSKPSMIKPSLLPLQKKLRDR